MDPKLTRSYSAKQAKPVFIHDDPELRAEEAWGPRLALITLACAAAAFVGFMAFLYFT